MSHYILGIDVSRYQGTIDWKKVAASGEIRFAAIRATIGSIYKDPRFIENWNGAKEAGILTTAYHVVRWDVTAEAQQENFMSMYESIDGEYDLPIALDVELPVPAGSSQQHQDTITNASKMSGFLRGLNPIPNTEGHSNSMIYTGAWWWNPVYKYWYTSHAFNSLPEWLWTAHYSSDPAPEWKPPAYDPWDEWSIWQYTSSGMIYGIEGPCDVNKVDTDSEFYKLYLDKESEPPLPPEPEPECHVINLSTDKPVTIIINKS